MIVSAVDLDGGGELRGGSSAGDELVTYQHDELVPHDGELVPHDGGLVPQEGLVTHEGNVLEPHVGMEFESEEAAKAYYYEYAQQTGFMVRILQCRRSEIDGTIIARGYGCNKEGFCPKKKRRKSGFLGKPPQSSRGGCKAMIIVRSLKDGRWAVRKFEKEHNHPLEISTPEVPATMDLKDMKIRELTVELRHKKRLCASYRDQLAAIIKDVEEHSNQLSKKAHVVDNTVKEIGTKQKP